MRAYTGLASMFKERDNPSLIGTVIGKVERINPFKISIMDGQILLDESNLYICKNVKEYQIKYSLNAPNGAVSGTITHEGVKAGDSVALVATTDNQKFIVIDKIE